MDLRRDPHLGTLVHVVGTRQARPNLPAGCPFCPGGVEAPDDYDVRWFPNRWPAMEGDRCKGSATVCPCTAPGAGSCVPPITAYRHWSSKTGPYNPLGNAIIAG